MGPLWGEGVDDRLYFEGSSATCEGGNRLANPQATVHLESGSDMVLALRANA